MPHLLYMSNRRGCGHFRAAFVYINIDPFWGCEAIARTKLGTIRLTIYSDKDSSRTQRGQPHVESRCCAVSVHLQQA